MRALTLMIAAAAACGPSNPASPSTPPPAPEPAPPPAPEPAASALPPCPAGDALRERAAEVFQVPVADVARTPACAIGRFPRPAWALLVTLWEHDEPEAATGASTRLAIVDASGAAERAPLWGGHLPVWAGDEDNVQDHDLQASDFDGDGTDELLFVHTNQHKVPQSSIRVVRRRGTEWIEVMARTIAWDETDVGETDPPVTCTATWKVGDPDSDGRRTLRLIPDGPSPAPDCVQAPETWVPDAGGTFVLRK